jgi:hypothetical protein
MALAFQNIRRSAFDSPVNASGAATAATSAFGVRFVTDPIHPSLDAFAFWAYFSPIGEPNPALSVQ